MKSFKGLEINFLSIPTLCESKNRPSEDWNLSFVAQFEEQYSYV